MSRLIALFICLQIILCVNAQTWSTWTPCVSPETCDTKTLLNCAGGSGSQCRSNGSLPYKITLSSACNGSCDALNDSQWEQPYIHLKCQGNCYDSVQINGYTCTSIKSCRRLEYFRCFNAKTCTGVWNQTLTQCSSSCGGGTRSVISTCVDITPSMTPFNCNGTFYGKYKNFTTNQSCNTQSCPAWSSWNAVTSCSKSCGNGAQRVNSTCMYNGTISMLCSEGNITTREQNTTCNLQACSGGASYMSSFIGIEYAVLVILNFVHFNFSTF